MKAGECRCWSCEGAEYIQLLVKDSCSSAGCSAAGGRKRRSRDMAPRPGTDSQRPSFLHEPQPSGFVHSLNTETQLGRQQMHRIRSCSPKALEQHPFFPSQSSSQGRQTPLQAFCLGEGAEKDRGKRSSKPCTRVAKNLITCHLLSLSHTLLPQGLADFFPLWN